jgi:predicted Ser/Thr protein kinase
MAEEPEDPDDATVTAPVSGSAPTLRASGSPRDTAPLPLEPEVGERIGRYRIEERLGEGGMGVVFRGYDSGLERAVAIKLLRGRAVVGNPDLARRLVREAQAAARLSHPNVVSVYEVDAAECGPFIAMEYVPGQTLREWLRARGRSWREILEVFCEAGLGLAAAHEVGLVHRDVKPDNILVDADRARVADFGIARPVEDTDVGKAPGDGLGMSATITRTGSIVGTPRYMAPEQREGRECDGRSDQYSFCIALHEALYGHVPSAEPPPQPPRPVPDYLSAVIERGLALSPARRYPSMASLLDALRPPPSRRRWWPMAAAALLAAGAVGYLLVPAGSSEPDRCAGAGAEISKVWNSQTRRALPVSLARRIDEQADRWRAAKKQVCRDLAAGTGSRATRIHRARERCLERQLERLRLSLPLLGRGGAGDERVIDAVAGARCDDLDALSRAPRRPGDDASKSRLAAVEDELDRISVGMAAGDAAAFSARADVLVGEARELDYAPLIASALRVQATTASAVGDYGEARAALEESIRLSSTAGDDAAVAASWIELLGTVGIGQGKTDEALSLRPAVEAALARAGERPELRARYRAVVNRIRAGKR